MLRSWSFKVILFSGLSQLLAVGESDDGWEHKRDENGRAVQSLKIEAPAMTEEDQYGYNMPDKYKCDSCRAVMFHIDQDFRKKQPKSRRLKSWEYTDMFEDTCSKAFEGYGIKLLNGENVLSGPGLKDEVAELKPGMGAIQMGGDNWKKRLAEECRKIVFEKVGEEETYEYLYSQLKAERDTNIKDFCLKEAAYCTAGPKTPPKPKETKKEKEKTAKEKKQPEKKEKAKKQKTEKAESTPKTKTVNSAADSAAKIDVQAFLRNLASKHGSSSDEYLKSRTHSEWEKLLVKVAGKIFNTQSEEL